MENLVRLYDERKKDSKDWHTSLGGIKKLHIYATRIAVETDLAYAVILDLDEAQQELLLKQLIERDIKRRSSMFNRKYGKGRRRNADEKAANNH